MGGSSLERDDSSVCAVSIFDGKTSFESTSAQGTLQSTGLLALIVYLRLALVLAFEPVLDVRCRLSNAVSVKNIPKSAGIELSAANCRAIRAGSGLPSESSGNAQFSCSQTSVLKN